MMQGSGQFTVPPGFRFHPTDEELLYYYLRKKVSYEAIDLDVIREVDLNKLEPWDLKGVFAIAIAMVQNIATFTTFPILRDLKFGSSKEIYADVREKCRIGSGPQNEWYFFSHKDKKYPTGTRTNRATAAGFWKATGRDKAIYLSDSKRIGMRKTLVFYTGRAPHGQKTEWIMHEYRLEEDDAEVQEDGWVVCRVFKKKNIINRGFHQEMEEEEHLAHMRTSNSCLQVLEQKQHHMQGLYDHYNFDASMHLPQLFSPESAVAVTPTTASFAATSVNAMDILECSQNLLRLTSNSNGCGLNLMIPQEQHQQRDHQQRFSNGDWSFLDKLLASHHQGLNATSAAHAAGGSSTQKFPFHYLGCEPEIVKFSK